GRRMFLDGSVGFEYETTVLPACRAARKICAAEGAKLLPPARRITRSPSDRGLPSAPVTGGAAAAAPAGSCDRQFVRASSTGVRSSCSVKTWLSFCWLGVSRGGGGASRGREAPSTWIDPYAPSVRAAAAAAAFARACRLLPRAAMAPCKASSADCAG